MAPPVHQSHSIVTGFVSATSIVFTEPSGVGATDIVVAKLYLNAAKTVTPPSAAWFQPANANLTQALNGTQEQIWWKRGEAGGSYTFTWTGATGKVGSCHRISGCIASGDPFDVTDHQKTDTASATSPVVQVTTTVIDTLLLHFAQGFTGGGVWNPPTGFTEVFESADIVTNWKTQAAAGATGALTGNQGSSSGRQIAFLGALKPVAAATTPNPYRRHRNASRRR